MAPESRGLRSEVGSETEMKKNDTDDFEEPRDMADAKNRLVVLRTDIDDIDDQLGTGDKPHYLMSDESYVDWKRSAKTAKKWKKAEASRLRNWMQVRNFTALDAEDVSAGGLLLATLPILNTAAENGLVDSGNQIILNAVRVYIKDRFPSIGGLITGSVTEEIDEVHS